jgi:hypothetical protein
VSGSRPSRVTLSPGVDAWLRTAKDQPALGSRFKKVKKAIKNLRNVGPSYRGFHTPAMKHLPAHDGRKIWNSYIESRTPSARRMYWIYDDGGIYVLSIGPHGHHPGGESG